MGAPLGEHLLVLTASGAGKTFEFFLLGSRFLWALGKQLTKP
jgi:hypothetical protein